MLGYTEISSINQSSNQSIIFSKKTVIPDKLWIHPAIPLEQDQGHEPCSSLEQCLLMNIASGGIIQKMLLGLLLVPKDFN